MYLSEVGGSVAGTDTKGGVLVRLESKCEVTTCDTRIGVGKVRIKMAPYTSRVNSKTSGFRFASSEEVETE